MTQIIPPRPHPIAYRVDMAMEVLRSCLTELRPRGELATHAERCIDECQVAFRSAMSEKQTEDLLC